jgi:murein DD-endopeptidase MepM/ murein hydrolase activator NlpD
VRHLRAERHRGRRRRRRHRAAGTNGLDGTVVWLYDPLAGRTFYYAHLDRWAIDGLTRVRAGDVLGYVGSTGNARGTSPHLHFGMYERGAIDPLPFIRPDDELPRAISLVGVAPVAVGARAWLCCLIWKIAVCDYS